MANDIIVNSLGTVKGVSYVGVTETPETRASSEQIGRLFRRYHFAFLDVADKDVLEVACGAGMGLGYLARRARRVVGGDIDPALVESTKINYSSRANVEVMELDAMNLPFEDDSFDLVILFEAIYYLPAPEIFLREAKRVLRKGGKLYICSANIEWDEFNPSPNSRRYFKAKDLVVMMRECGFETELYGDCPIQEKKLISKFVGVLKKMAVRFDLMPRTMKGKEFLKRIFFGELQSIPREINESMSPYIPLAKVENIAEPFTKFKVIFCVGRL
ncbi:MAG: hypothetical protein CVV64_11345 [Candidatus Wallbacteria bacterium HGW-Wallbacteria-1]|jgi:SAM-dependent methyltransferase|uniref:Methyltransferase type 11 domain-containing protein n=1 Tax=Candidatus Wallbacteria bacterium HGW-Wallbacteria-1 TaxID=2013854 RepID=A0A2N1PP44_9BACT|nr:MAG: hypothetical protein CVV64_11345 [Candidatus Wallbacteria bacterium HGW-Wallbacteria-1]